MKITLRILLPCLCLVVIGCNPPRQKATKSSSTTGQAQETNAGSEQLISSVLEMLRGIPERSMYPTILKQLNQYFASRSEDIGKLDNDVRQRVATYLGPQALADLEQKDLGVSDLDYLVSSIFFQHVNRSLRSEEYGPVEYAQRLFDWTVRHMQVMPSGSVPPGPPMEMCLRGTGSAEDRAWIFLELLRQADLTGCVIALASKESNELVPWLAGVIVDEDVYLFHPELGVPIPSPDRPVATLQELAKSPQILDALQIDSKLEYKVAPGPVEQVAVLVVIEAPMVSPKMELLQSKLTGENRANLHLDMDRLVELGQKAVAKVPENAGLRIWQRPAQIRTTSYRHQQFYQAFAETLNPFWLRLENSPRMLQLTGRNERAVERYVDVDMKFRAEEMNEMLKQAGMDAARRGQMISQTRQDILYFTGICQFGLANPRPEVAQEWLDRYLSEYGSPFLSETDVLAWGEFCGRIASDGQSDKPSVPGRIWKLMTPEGQSLVARVAANAGRLQQVEAELAQLKRYVQELQQESAEFGNNPELQEQFRIATETLRQKGQQQQEILSLDLSARRSLIQAVNEVLKRNDLYQADKLAEDTVPAQVRETLEKRASSMTAAQWVRFNRQLLDRTFPEQISRSVEHWVPGAIRHKAIALHLQGKTQEAIALLREDHSELPVMYQAAYQAMAAQWSKSAPADSEDSQ